MPDDRTTQTAFEWSDRVAGLLYLPEASEPRTEWPHFSMRMFRCDLHPDADLDVSLIAGAVDTLSQAAYVNLAPTSVRIPARLRELAQAVVDHRWVDSISDLLVTGLRDQLGALTAEAIRSRNVEDTRAALEEHYAGRENERSGLAELAIAAAEIEGHPAADHPDLVARAVQDLSDDAYIEDVLAWVRGALAITHGAVGT